MSSDIAVLVFSNIDGFLPHVFDASSGEVAEVLHRLQSSAVSIVLCSSQTRAEVEAAQQALGIAAPFVCESGCAAFVPRGYVPVGVSNVRDVAGYYALEMGRPHGEVAAALKRVASGQRVDVRGFQDMAVEEVARACRMSLLQARLAKLREYGERFRILDPREATRRRLFVALERAGLRCLYGDPCHQVGTAVNTDAAVRMIQDLYRAAFGAVLSVGASEATAPFSGPDLSVPNAAMSGAAMTRWVASIDDSVRSLRRRL